MEENKGFFDSMSKSQSFTFGIVGGVLVLCTIGFFVMLGLFMNGSVGSSGVSVVPANEEGPKKFSQCLDSSETASLVSADTNLGASLGVSGTPGTIINGYALSGALPYAVLKDVADDLIAGNEPFIDNYEQYGMETGSLEKVGEPTLLDPVWRGNEKASVSFVEFSDFECPYCSRFADSVDQLLASHGDDIRFTYRHFPLSFHQNAQKAAESFECAKAQGKAFEMHDKLFDLAKTNQLSIANFKKAATELKLK